MSATKIKFFLCVIVIDSDRSDKKNFETLQEQQFDIHFFEPIGIICLWTWLSLIESIDWLLLFQLIIFVEFLEINTILLISLKFIDLLITIRTSSW